jgi:hypothetical protein
VRHAGRACAGRTDGLPAGYVISEKATLSWSEDNDRLFFGVRPQELTPKKDETGWQKTSDVDVFHWNDDRIQSVQRRQADQDRNRTDRAVLHLARPARRAADRRNSARYHAHAGRPLGHRHGRPRLRLRLGAAARGLYRVDVATGTRTPVLEAHGRTLGLSPDSRRLLYWKDEHVWAYELATDRHVNLTARAPVSFVNGEWDYLSDPPPYGIAGYTADGRGVVLNHRFDLWYVPFDGGAPRNLTNGIGGEHSIRFRYVRPTPTRASSTCRGRCCCPRSASGPSRPATTSCAAAACASWSTRTATSRPS